MSRFHEEFFQRTSSKHDQLVVETILEAYDVIMKQVESLKEQEKQVNVNYCTDRRYCGAEVSYLEDLPRCCDCEFTLKSEYGYSLAPPSFEPEFEEVLVWKSVDYYDIDYTVETEKLFTSPVNGFMIGYADIVLTVTAHRDETVKTEKENWRNHQLYEYYIIVDAKPVLKSWGGPVRQLKTYMHLQREATNKPVYGVISTYDTLPDHHTRVIQQENIQIYTMEEDLKLV